MEIKNLSAFQRLCVHENITQIVVCVFRAFAFSTVAQ